MNRFLSTYVIGIATSVALAAPVLAQEATATRKDSKTDWSIFVEEPPAVDRKSCWLASAPTKVENTRNGRPAEVNRGEIVMFVTYLPGQVDGNGEPIDGQVSFASGYPFPENGTAEVQIGSARYTLQTIGETAYSISREDDEKMRNSMKRGAEAIITSVSARGTNTKDTFSLNGFTAAVEEIEKLCGA